MKEFLKSMSYEEFERYCNERACDGKWSFDQAIFCLDILSRINKIKVNTFGIFRKKKTKIAREKEYQKIINE